MRWKIWVSFFLVVVFAGSWAFRTLNLHLDPFAKPHPHLVHGLGSAQFTNDFDQMQMKFTTRLRDTFELPIRKDELADALRAHGLIVYDEHKFASFYASGFPCNVEYRVSWEPKNDVVVSLKGRIFSLCL